MYLLLSMCIPCPSALDQKSNSEPLRWKIIRWIFCKELFRGALVNYFCKILHFRCSPEFEYHSADSRPL